MVYLMGPIVQYDSVRLQAVLNEHPEARYLHLDSTGGDFYEAVKVGTIVKARGMSTVAGGVCQSSCAFMWLAGAWKMVDTRPGWLIQDLSFHSPYNSGTLVTYKEAAALMGWYIGSLGYEFAQVADMLLFSDPSKLIRIDRFIAYKWGFTFDVYPAFAVANDPSIKPIKEPLFFVPIPEGFKPPQKPDPEPQQEPTPEPEPQPEPSEEPVEVEAPTKPGRVIVDPHNEAS